MKNLFVKIITGFRKDQEYTIPADECHKAYYLFLNPEKRGVFATGLALIGADIRKIEPDYHATMDWNQTYTLGTADWEQINGLGLDKKFQVLLSQAKLIAQNEPEKINQPLSQVARLESKTNYQGQIGGALEKYKKFTS
jgi:hypothetical protein